MKHSNTGLVRTRDRFVVRKQHLSGIIAHLDSFPMSRALAEQYAETFIERLVRRNISHLCVTVEPEGAPAQPITVLLSTARQQRLKKSA